MVADPTSIRDSSKRLVERMHPRFYPDLSAVPGALVEPAASV